MNIIRRHIQAGQPSIGSWLMHPGAFAAECFGRAGFPWVIVDLQHGGNTWDSVGAAMPALELGGTRGLVRVGWNEPAGIMRALDMGAIGVVIPSVSDAQEAQSAARATRYPPVGQRSLGPIRGRLDPRQVLDADPLCVVMIETAAGLRNVEAIAATAQVDALLLGPGDLAIELGLPAALAPGQAVHAGVLEAAEKIVAACARHGKIPAAAAFSEPAVTEFLSRGIKMVAYGSDSSFMQAGAAAALQSVASWTARFSSTPCNTLSCTRTSRSRDPE